MARQTKLHMVIEISLHRKWKAYLSVLSAVKVNKRVHNWSVDLMCRSTYTRP